MLSDADAPGQLTLVFIELANKDDPMEAILQLVATLSAELPKERSNEGQHEPNHKNSSRQVSGGMPCVTYLCHGSILLFPGAVPR